MFLKVFIYLFIQEAVDGGETEGERGTTSRDKEERREGGERDLQFPSSLSYGHNDQSWTVPKLEARSLFLSPMQGAWAQNLGASFTAFPVRQRAGLEGGQLELGSVPVRDAGALLCHSVGIIQRRLYLLCHSVGPQFACF